MRDLKPNRPLPPIRSVERAATIQDVAREAGVAVGTVSRYLNGFQLRPANRQQVADAIKRLGYKQNYIAKGMKTRKTYTVGFALTTSDEYQIQIIRSLERRLYANGYTLIICDYENDLRILETKLDFFLDRYVDGVVAAPLPRSAGAFAGIEERGIPIVFCDNTLPAVEADTVTSDNRAGARAATEYLLSMGHRRIGFLGGPRSGRSTATERLRGHREALDGASIAHDPRLILAGSWERESGYRNTIALLDGGALPTAVFAANYLIAIGALRALKERGLRIPEDISLLSFDDVDTFAVYQPGITAVRQHATEIGMSCADLLLDRLRGEAPAQRRTIRLATELVVRESVRRMPPPPKGQL